MEKKEGKIVDVKDACNGMKATLRATKTTQINKKIYYDVLAFENGSLNRIATNSAHTSHATSATKATTTNFRTGTENTGLIIHNKVKIL